MSKIRGRNEDRSSCASSDTPWLATGRFIETTIQAADISEPIIMVEIRPGMFNVIDGHHRLEKAYRFGMTKTLAYKIPAGEHIRFLTSTEAYAAYVQYWNEKLKDWVRYSGNRETALS